MGFLMAHGTITELIQLHVPGRSGSLHDVALDQLGITLGMLASWKWWTAPSPEPAAATSPEVLPSEGASFK
jgi:hypothetical protein